MIRAVLGVLVGYGLWTAVFLGGAAGLSRAFPEEQAAFDAGGDYRATLPLALFVVLSVMASLVAGRSTAWIAGRRARAAVLVMALALLATGIAVEASAWSRMPLWYHVAFLALLVPACLLGGHRRAREAR